MSTVTEAPAVAIRRRLARLRGVLAGHSPWPAGLPGWLPGLLGVVAWAAAIAAIEPVVHGYLTSAPDQRMVDLDVYRTSGLSVLQGQPLYAILTQSPQLLPFTYPPVAAVFAVPLALMPWGAAQLAWVPLIYVPLAVTIWYAFRPLLRRAGPLRPVAFAALFGVCAYLFPMRDQMRFGQVDMLLAALCVADCAVSRPRWPRGALIGLATAVKLVPGVFIIYLLVSGRRRAAATAALCAGAWTAGAFLLMPRDSVYYWTTAIFDSGRLGSNTGTSNQSLRGLLLRFFLPGHAPGALWVAVAIVVGVAGFAAARRVARDGYEMAGVAIAGLLGVALSPVSWIHHLIWVVVAIGAIAGDGRLVRRAVTAAGAAVFYIMTIPWWGNSLLYVPGVPRMISRLIQGGFGAGVVALIVIIARMRKTPGDLGPSGSGVSPDSAVPPQASTAGRRLS